MPFETRDNDAYFEPDACRVADLAALIDRRTGAQDAPAAATIERDVPIYDAPSLAPALSRPEPRRVLLTEWARVLRSGAGVLVLRQAQPDHAAIDAATAEFTRLIAAEKRRGGGADHFAAPGANDRIWNAHQKLALAAPEVFVRYMAAPAIDAICEAWLGPAYQITAQVNLVHPGGAAQEAHRDYHLGFQTAARSAAYPAHVHDLSPFLTLQGGLAHGPTPLESGPTKLLPFSQTYRAGYAAFRRAEFRAFFEERHVQVPLEKGDALFFNPALFHAAGANKSADIHRLVNLFQISSAFGRAMESVDRSALCRAVFPALRSARARGELATAEVHAVIAATAEGYPFPTNLDADPPAGGLAPASQQDLLAQAVREGWPAYALAAALEAQAARRRA